MQANLQEVSVNVLSATGDTVSSAAALAARLPRG